MKNIVVIKRSLKNI